MFMKTETEIFKNRKATQEALKLSYIFRIQQIFIQSYRSLLLKVLQNKNIYRRQIEAMNATDSNGMEQLTTLFFIYFFKKKFHSFQSMKF
jgi:hypothetical protein